MVDPTPYILNSYPLPLTPKPGWQGHRPSSEAAASVGLLVGRGLRKAPSDPSGLGFLGFPIGAFRVPFKGFLKGSIRV